MEINTELLELLWQLARGSDEDKPNIKAIELLIRHQPKRLNPYEFLSNTELIRELETLIEKLKGGEP